MDLNKLKNSRSSPAGWVTRTLNKFEENNNYPAALDVLSDRIQGQLKRFSRAHDAYVSAEGNEEDIENAERQYEEYFDMATKCLCEIDERIKELRREEASNQEVKQPIPLPVSYVSVCLICSMDHHLTKCKDYLLKTPEERYDFVKQHRSCFNCLD